MQDVPEDLITTPWWPRLEQASASMPLPCHSIFLECHLSDDVGRTDLIARFLEADRDALPEGRGHTFPLAENFFARWANASDPLHSMSFVDVEWDIGARGDTPFMCPTLEPILWASPDEIEAARLEDEARGRPRRARTLVRHVLRTLYEDSVSEPLLVRLDEAFDALPPYACIHYVNYLPLRKGGSTGVLRAIVSLLRQDLCGLLQRLGFPGDIDRACDRVNRYCPYGPWTNVDIDIRLEGLGSRLGIYNEFPRPRPTDRVLSEMLERLAEDGLASRKRLSALSSWLGHPRHGLTFKVVTGSDEELAVKAYLEIGSEPL